MKQKYTKPQMTTFQFSMTEAISSCAVNVTNAVETCTKINYDTFEKYFPDVLADQEASGGKCFDVGSCEVQIDGYCYFTSTYTLTFGS